MTFDLLVIARSIGCGPTPIGISAGGGEPPAPDLTFAVPSWAIVVGVALVLMSLLAVVYTTAFVVLAPQPQ